MDMTFTITTESWKASGWVITLILIAMVANALLVYGWYNMWKIQYNPQNTDQIWFLHVEFQYISFLKTQGTFG